MIVVDANVVVLALVSVTARGSAARDVIGDGTPLAAPDFFALEVANGLRSLAERQQITHQVADDAFADLLTLEVHLLKSQDLLGRVWQLRRNVTCYDAAYLATAESLGCDLVTADSRIVRSGATIRCAVRIIPN